MTHWVFDLDGTLIDSFTQYFDALREIFALNNLQITDEDFLQSLHLTAKNFLEMKLGTEAGARAYMMLGLISKRDTHKVRAFDGIHDVLTHLKDKGAEISLWTNRDRHTAEIVLRDLKLNHFFSTYVTGTCVANAKPHPEGLQKILDYFGCSPDSVVMVGDHDIDMMGAKALGARAIRVSWSAKQPVAQCALADSHFHRVEDLKHWINTNL